MKQFDVVGIGNAIVDVLCHVEDRFIDEHHMQKGGMQLIDEDQARAIYAGMGPSRPCSGGSAANTLAGMAKLGSKTAFIGKVRDDQFGDIFRHDMQSIGVHFETLANDGGPATACSYIVVTPDGERTMNTFLGAAGDLHADDIEAERDLIADAQVLYVEGYLWDKPHTIEAIRMAMKHARETGGKVAFTLSDLFCVDRHREAFCEIVQNDIDILFANAAEIMALYEQDDFEAALAALQGSVEVGVVTRGESGAYVVTADAITQVPTQAVAELVDTTGAGDLFAAGVLYGYCRRWPLTDATMLGNRCAGEVIQQVGARVQGELQQLVA